MKKFLEVAFDVLFLVTFFASAYVTLVAFS